MMAYAFNPSSWEAEADRSLWVPGHSGLHSSQGHIVRPCLKRICIFRAIVFSGDKLECGTYTMGLLEDIAHIEGISTIH